MTPDGHYELWVDMTPPSFNRAGMTGSRWKLIKAVKGWRELLGALMMEAQVPRGCSHVVASATITFPVKRRRDEENFRVVLSKALGDALQDYGAIPDDTAEFYRLDLKLEVDPGVTRTTILLECA
jgi:hypothetical protein